MASQALIVAHKNDFNGAILKENAYYFNSAEQVKKVVQEIKKSDNLQFIQNNFEAITSEYNWDKINGAYLQLFEQSLSENQ
jgi:glycosyltransferase involved in cell wall biosynthesis